MVVHVAQNDRYEQLCGQLQMHHASLSERCTVLVADIESLKSQLQQRDQVHGEQQALLIAQLAAAREENVQLRAALAASTTAAAAAAPAPVSTEYHALVELEERCHRLSALLVERDAHVSRLQAALSETRQQLDEKSVALHEAQQEARNQAARAAHAREELASMHQSLQGTLSELSETSHALGEEKLRATALADEVAVLQEQEQQLRRDNDRLTEEVERLRGMTSSNGTPFRQFLDMRKQIGSLQVTPETWRLCDGV
jgi:chromosome segregation ATPase